MSKIFITGGKGILGSRLVISLLSDHDVYAPDKKDCNITNLEEVKKMNLNELEEDISHLSVKVACMTSDFAMQVGEN